MEKRLKFRSYVLVLICVILIVGYCSSCFVVLVNTQSKIFFSIFDTFEIPEKDFSFRFALNGSCQSAILDDGYWVFEDLQFESFGEEGDLFLKVRGEDCEIVVNSYYTYNRTYDEETVKRARLSYRTFGGGVQEFNLGLDPKLGLLDVRLNREWVGRNNGWTLSSDGTFSVTGATANVTLLYYGFPESFAYSSDFVTEHSVLVVTSVFLGIIVVLVIGNKVMGAIIRNIKRSNWK